MFAFELLGVLWQKIRVPQKISSWNLRKDIAYAMYIVTSLSGGRRSPFYEEGRGKLWVQPIPNEALWKRVYQAPILPGCEDYP